MSRTGEFERARPLLFAIAHRILGSPGAARHAVHTAWLRYEAAPAVPADPQAFLTALVTRTATDALHAPPTTPGPAAPAPAPQQPAAPADPTSPAAPADPSDPAGPVGESGPAAAAASCAHPADPADPVGPPSPPEASRRHGPAPSAAPGSPAGPAEQVSPAGPAPRPGPAAPAPSAGLAGPLEAGPPGPPVPPAPLPASAAAVLFLERLPPLERAVFVLREIFGRTLAQTASVVGCSPAACRRLAAASGAGTGPGGVPPWPGLIAGATPVARVLGAVVPALLDIGVTMEPRPPGPRPGAVFRDRTGTVLGVLTLDVLDGRIQTVRWGAAPAASARSHPEPACPHPDRTP
ncbi:sigma factor-like helix-turn-helix DNA-binding protein [Streptomyces sp. NPDC096013]|uniref:sigma factor-like helix-turn-helix DNA-binding protein n=1 Tax=Streptomyces sp. NPDC096013 TaxID=3366069 RepID=UPI0038202439